MWRKLRNAISLKDSLGTKTLKFKSGPVTVYLFKCLVCSKDLEIRKQHIPYSTGKCKKHSGMLRPFEASFGAIKKSAKERNLSFNLTYNQYIKFTKIKNCYYCNNLIQWNPYNEHGKNSPAYYLDRKQNKVGYSKNNCVVCCTTCNWAKRNMKFIDFINMCKQVAKNHKGGGSCGS